MTKELQNTLIEILTYFKSGLDDVQAGTFNNERQTMQDEIDFALPLVKKLIIADVSNRRGLLIADMVKMIESYTDEEISIVCDQRNEMYGSNL